MKLFVTGGAGYVGSHCVRCLLDAGHEVVVFDSLVSGHRKAVDPRARLVQGDLADTPALTRCLRDERPDGVLHFAAFIDVGESVRDPVKYYRNNICNSVSLLDAMQRADVRRMVFSSTCATYGYPTELPLTEEQPQIPINPYGRTKLAIEWLLRDAAEAWGLGAVALRYFNASGAAADGTIGEDHRPETHLIPLILQVPLGQREFIQVFGTDYPTSDGSCVRDYIHVEDLSAVHERAITRIEGPGLQAYNVGTGNGYTVLEVIAAARTVTGHGIPIRIGPRRPGDPPELFANADRAKRQFGWEPRYRTIEAIVGSAWRWHSAHPHGYV